MHCVKRKRWTFHLLKVDHYRVASKSNFKVRKSDEDHYQMVPCGSGWRQVVVTFP